MTYHMIGVDILLISRIFPRLEIPRNSQRYTRVLYVQPSNKVYLINTCTLIWYSIKHDLGIFALNEQHQQISISSLLITAELNKIWTMLSFNWTLSQRNTCPVSLELKAGLRKSCQNIPQTQPPPQEREVSCKVRKRLKKVRNIVINFFFIYCFFETHNDNYEIELQYIPWRTKLNFAV